MSEHDNPSDPNPHFDNTDFDSITNFLAKFGLAVDPEDEGVLWIPRDDKDWEWSTQFISNPTPYETYVANMNALAETFRKAGCKFRVVTIGVPAVRQMIDDAGLRCDDLVSRTKAISKVTGSPFVQMEEDLMEAGLRAGFPPDDDAPLGRPTMHDT